MNHRWHTAWVGGEIAVYRDETEIDRLDAETIRRIVFVYRANGDSPGDLLYALVESDADYVWLAAETGFAGRVNFERLAFWVGRKCIFWAPQRAADLPLRLRRGGGWLGLAVPAFRHVPKSELDAAISAWPLEGPQTWDERKWGRIARNRPFAALELPRNVRP